MLYPVILSGGSGIRLWPLSRDYFPKQFLPLITKRTMLQETLSRLDGLREVARPLIVCNEAHRFLVADQMREIHKDPLQIIIEPVGRNTAPALTLAALNLTGMGRSDTADPVMVVMPADSPTSGATQGPTGVKAMMATAVVPADTPTSGTT